MRTYHYWVLFTAFFALSVIVAGAWVRLTDAGLGCPDWPGCYGQLIVPGASTEIDKANRAFPERPVEQGKAWREMIHRYMASALGLLILGLAVVAWMRRANKDQPIKVPMFLVLLVIFQGLLGMWTVTLLLKPLIVMGHLVGGLATLSLLIWLGWQTRYPQAKRITRSSNTASRKLITFSTIALIVLTIQIMLGGWTSTNYAALACPDFPKCQDQWIPEGADYAEGFVPWRGLGVDYEGGVLEHPARVAVHYVHRIGAIVAFLVIGMAAGLGLKYGSGHSRRTSWAVKVFLLLQIAIGIVIIKYALPLSLAVAHNGNAALLLASVVTANFFARREIS